MSDIESLKERLELSDCETDEQLAQYWHQEAIEARSKLAEAERALEFYGNRERYASHAPVAYDGEYDDGEIARDALAAIREEEPLPAKQGE